MLEICKYSNPNSKLKYTNTQKIENSNPNLLFLGAYVWLQDITYLGNRFFIFFIKACREFVISKESEKNFGNSAVSGVIRFCRIIPYFWKIIFLFASELGNQPQSNQIVVINLTIVIHIQAIVTFFPFFIVKLYSIHFQKKKAIFDWLCQ